MGPATQEERIGREFLLWLWYESERNSGLFRLTSGKSVEVWLGERLVLESVEGRTASDLTWRGDASVHDDVRLALGSGRQMRRAEFVLNMDGHEWRFVLEAESLDLRSLRIPRPEREGDDDPVSLGLERLYLIETAVRTVEELFKVFTGRRNASDWAAKEDAGIRKWLGRARA